MNLAVRATDLLPPARLVSTLRRLGPIAIKVGQYLALRPDLLPQAYCDELLTLTDRVPPFPWAQARAVLVAEFGRDPAEVFAAIERRPFAAGSLAQVHRARLDDGSEVAVKIQRPDLAAQIARDMRRLQRLAALMERKGVVLTISPRDLVDELNDWLTQEIDFGRERANVQRLRRLTRDDRLQVVPRAYAAYSGSRVLTYDYLGGTPLPALLAAGDDDNSRDGLTPAARRAFAENLVTACYTQIFRYRFFHADLHPGNLRLLPGNAVGFLDFGLCDRLDQVIRDNQLRYIAAVYDGDRGRMFKALLDVLVPTPDSDHAGLERDFAAETRGLGRASDDGERSPAALALIGIMQAARRNRFEVPRRVLAMYRALLTVDALAARLGLRQGLRRVGRRFFVDLQREAFVDDLFDRDKLQRFFVSSLTLTREAPGQINQILTDLVDGTLRLKVEVSDAPLVARQHNVRAKLSACALAAIAVAILIAGAPLPSPWLVPVKSALAAVLVLLYLGCFVLWRRLQR